MKQINYILIIFLFLHLNANSQKIVNGNGYSKVLSYKQYLSLATKSNLLLASERYKLSEAEAKISLAKIFPDPEFTFGEASGDITGQHLQQQLFVGFTQTIPRGGKYKQGIKIAKSESELGRAFYEDYLRVFKLDVTKRFINVLIAQMTYEKDRRTNELMQSELKKKQSSNEINDIELYRIQIEAGQILDQLYQSEVEFEVALYDLYIPLSNFNKDSTINVKGTLDLPFRKFNIDSILPYAIDNRTDIVAAKKKYQISEEYQRLTKANRRKDLSVTIGNNSYTEATNYIGPTPSYQAITAMLAFPLAFSNLHKEDLKIAELQKLQSKNEALYIENLIKIEISQSYDKYLIAERQLSIYKNGLLQNGDKVLEKELENYKAGKSSFLDLSESHRKLDEVYHGYFSALKTYVYSLIELEDDMGIWDLDF